MSFYPKVLAPDELPNLIVYTNALTNKGQIKKLKTVKMFPNDAYTVNYQDVNKYGPITLYIRAKFEDTGTTKDFTPTTIDGTTTSFQLTYSRDINGKPFEPREGVIHKGRFNRI